MAKKARDESRSGSRQNARFTADLETEAAATHLEAIARALRDSRVVIEADEDLDVRVGPRVLVDLRARSTAGGRKTSLEVSLRWNAPADSGTLAISSGAIPDDKKDDENRENEETESPETSSPTWTPE